ncbi:Leucine aminopeptidase 2 [Colletotrichum tanaceti]|uniref:Peptide hydrolase n=1 Tax=Colletotrichum tanaceti TaxID=1306861 RepID=A0A4U6XNF1_9PEZI|nr:Leucine aminopeptidase 2 [Colletotrichum tanaceti]
MRPRGIARENDTAEANTKLRDPRDSGSRIGGLSSPIPAFAGFITRKPPAVKMKLSVTSALVSWASLGACVIHERQTSKPLVDSGSFQQQITKANLEANLVRLSDIAKANGGNRAFGYPGYDASVDFIWSRISAVQGAKVWKQDFPAVFSSELRARLTVDGKNLAAYALTGSPFTPAAGITAELTAGPEGVAACEAASYADLDVAGKIVLVREALCPGYRSGYHAGVMKPAAAAGAEAVIVINDFYLNLTAGILGPADDGTYVPTGFVNQYVGDPLKARLDAGETLTATFWEDESVDSRVTQNVFAETEGGDENNVIVLGAHLDSVARGPGINDNGSGTSLLLELFLALSRYSTRNKIRFAWWGAEERGLVGSRYHVDNLSAAEAASILAYLNFDMVARGYYGVFDGDGASYGVAAPPGSDVIQDLFAAEFAARGVNVTAARFTNGSDYASFWQVLNKPIGGLHTGTASAQDPCYHQQCDDINNPDLDQLTTTAHVLSALALDGTNLIKKLGARGLPVRSAGGERIVATVEESDDEHHHC